MHRLFFALVPPEGATPQLVRAARIALDAAGPGARATSASRYHLTLRFLGGFPALPEEVAQAAAEAASAVHCAPFDLAIDRLGGFPGARVWWLGSSDVPGGLLDLHARLGDALAAHGVAVDGHDGFTPHLTIVRGVRGTPPLRAIEPVAWRVDAFVLLHSSPGQGYAELGRWPLRRGAGLNRGG
ncbi:MAG TPA: RNA 2',3'-cyclic phosphodiesterase [Lysobacter sp.]